MKALVTAVALGTVMASPAFATTLRSQRAVQTSSNAYAQYLAPDQQFVPHTGEVVVNDHIVGRDPDPRVRMQMRLDPLINDYDN
jgi:hypothetical protein